MDYKMDVKSLPESNRPPSEVEEGSIVDEKDSNFVSRWARTVAFEKGGIQRVTEEERLHDTTKWWNACTFW